MLYTGEKHEFVESTKIDNLEMVSCKLKYANDII